MAQTTLTTIADALRSDYDPIIRDQRNKKSVLVDKLSKNVGVTAMENNSFLIKLRTDHHSGWAFRAAGSATALPTGAPGYDEATVSAKFGYGTHDIEDSVLAAAKGKPGAAVSIAEDFALAVKDALIKDKNRQWLNRGGTEDGNAAIAVVNGTVSGTTITVEDGAGSTAGTPGLGTRFIKPGQIIEIGTEAELDAGTAESATVAARATRTTFTTSASESVVDGDYIVISGAHDNEMNGMKNIMSASNTFQGVARTSLFWAQAYVDSTAEALDEGDMADAFLEAEDRNGRPTVIITGRVLYKKYASLLTSMKRTANSVEVLGGGWTGLEFATGGNSVGVVLDNDCPYGDMNFISADAEYITVCELDSGWLDEGAGMFQRRDLLPSWWASYKFYGNLGVRGFAAHSALQSKTA